MKCNEFEKIVNEYVDGELKQSIDIEEHISSCDVCKALYEETLELKEILSGLDTIELPDDFEDTLHDKLLAVSKEMNETQKVIPIRKWHKQFKILGSIAAVMLLSVLAARTFPMMGSDNDSAMNDSFEMNTQNIAVMEVEEESSAASYASDDVADVVESETTDMEVAETAMVTTISPEAATSKAFTLRVPTQGFVGEGRTFYLKKTSLESIDRLIEQVNIDSLEILPNQYQFYIQTNQLDDFVNSLTTQFTIIEERQLNYSYELKSFYKNYNVKNEYIDSLEGQYAIATEGPSKDELKVRIEAETSVLSSYEIGFIEIERLKNYTQITIIINEE